MKNLLCVLLCSIPLLAQKPFPVNDQVGLRIMPMIYPKGAGMTGAHMEMSKDGGPIHRVLRDSSKKILFAYDIEVKLDNGFYHILTEPLNSAFAQKLQTDPVPTLSAVNDSVTMIGGSLMIELLTNPATGQKISDDIQLVDITPAGAAPDGNLHIWNADIWLNGAKITSETMPGGAVGPRFALYLRGSGGFFFSLLQPTEYPQFQKIGFIDGKRLKFVWGNKTFEVRSVVPILSNGASSEVWVFYDSQFKPKESYDPGMEWGTQAAMQGWLGKDDEENR